MPGQNWGQKSSPRAVVDFTAVSYDKTGSVSQMVYLIRHLIHRQFCPEDGTGDILNG